MIFHLNPVSWHTSDDDDVKTSCRTASAIQRRVCLQYNVVSCCVVQSFRPILRSNRVILCRPTTMIIHRRVVSCRAVPHAQHNDVSFIQYFRDHIPIHQYHPAIMMTLSMLMTIKDDDDDEATEVQTNFVSSQYFVTITTKSKIILNKYNSVP